MLCCPVAHYSPLLVPQHRTNLHSAFCTLHSALHTPHLHPANTLSSSCRPLLHCLLYLVSVSTVSCLASLALRPSPPLAAGRSPSQTTPSTRSTDQLSRLCHPINRLRPPQTAPATITSHPSQHFLLPKQNRPWALYRLGRMAPVRPQRKGVHIPHKPTVEPTAPPLTR